MTIFLIVMFFLILALILTFIQPLKYGSTSRIIVIQNFDVDTDPYAISKSNEYLSNILANVVTSSSFFDDILESGYHIDKNYFSKNNNINGEMKKWRETVQAKVVGDTGIIEINAYHPDKRQLDLIASAVNYVLQTKNGQYHGMASNVVIRIIDKPIISLWPVRPNIIFNLALAIVFGLLISFSYIYLFPEDRYNLRLWSRSNRKKIEEQKISSVQPADIKNQWEDLGDAKKYTEENLNSDDLEIPGEESASYKSLSSDDLDNNYGGNEPQDISIKGSINNIFRNPNRDDF